MFVSAVVGGGQGAATASVFEKSTSMPRSSSVEKKCTRSVIEGVGDKPSPSNEEKVGDSGS